MIVRATAIPLSCYPYSSTSDIVHWLTRYHGRVSTLLKGAFRPRSPFLGEYELFSTSELLYYTKRSGTLYTGKECALIEPRKSFRKDWRAMQAASYLSALFHKTTPEDAPQPELFTLYEELLDLAQEYGRHPQFLLWAELKFCSFHGHAPNFRQCVICESTNRMKFSAASGGVVCQECVRDKKLPTLDCPSDILSVLRSWQTADHPASAVNSRLDGRQLTALNSISGTFMANQFNLQPEHRNAALAA
jgi:DNA repair protein RecO (recombination protein O)